MRPRAWAASVALLIAACGDRTASREEPSAQPPGRGSFAGVWLLDHEFEARPLTFVQTGGGAYRVTLGCKGPDHVGTARATGGSSVEVSFPKERWVFHCALDDGGESGRCSGDVDAATRDMRIRRR